MSSTTIAVSPSDATLIEGTSQHEEYYYNKIEQYLYSHMAACIEESPNISMTKTWLSLGDAGQKTVIAKIKRSLKYGKARLNIEDDQAVSEKTFVLIGFLLADIAFPTPTRAKYDGKNSKKLGNPLLKTAICHARLEKQDQ